MKLSAQGICKSFGAGNVLDGVDFTVEGGNIYAFLGENGAGKSTLMNIIGGIYAPDSGNIVIDGKIVRFKSPADSQKSGIAFIHQELDLINDLTVYENLFLPDFITRHGALDAEAMIYKSGELFGRYNFDINPCMPVGELDLSHKQMVAISRALMQNASVIIMDEPTSSLTPVEITKLFEIMRSLKEKGIAIIFISHKLREVKEVCDVYAVLRDGRIVASGKVSDTTVNRIAAEMVGHEITDKKTRTDLKYGDTVLEIKNLSDEDNFSLVSLAVREGEILGVTGLLDDGHSEVFETVFGIHGGKYTGEILMHGKSIHPKKPSEALRQGIALLPKNRQENGIIPDASIVDNGTITAIDDYSDIRGFDTDRQLSSFGNLSNMLHIRMKNARDLITTLSGGNQQNTLLAKWILTEPDVLILDNPTQGVDVGAKVEIYTAIEEIAKKGVAVIVLSSESQEIIRLCERCIVMFRGKIVGEVSGQAMNEYEIMRLATGVGNVGKEENN